MRTREKSSGRRTPSANDNHAVPMPPAKRNGVQRAAASGRRRRSMSVGACSMSAPAMDTRPSPSGPETLGPDFDVSAWAALVTAAGRDLLVVPQKSGMAYALDPDKQGAAV